MNEIWKDIQGYEWKYQISNIGRVKSINYRRKWIENILCVCKNNEWHSSSWLFNNSNRRRYLISRLVAIAFIPNPNNLPCVCHIKEDLDENWLLYNWVDNLFWGTHSDNMQDMIKKWRDNNHFKLNHPKPTLWVRWMNSKLAKSINQYTKEWEFIRSWWSIIDVQRELWIYWSHISKCCRKINKYNSAGGFKWEYK